MRRFRGITLATVWVMILYTVDNSHAALIADSEKFSLPAPQDFVAVESLSNGDLTFVTRSQKRPSSIFIQLLAQPFHQPEEAEMLEFVSETQRLMESHGKKNVVWRGYKKVRLADKEGYQILFDYTFDSRKGALRRNALMFLGKDANSSLQVDFNSPVERFSVEWRRLEQSLTLALKPNSRSMAR